MCKSVGKLHLNGKSFDLFAGDVCKQYPEECSDHPETVGYWTTSILGTDDPEDDYSLIVLIDSKTSEIKHKFFFDKSSGWVVSDKALKSKGFEIQSLQVELD